MQFTQKRVSIWSAVIVAIVALSLVILLVQNQNNKDVHNVDPTPAPTAVATPKVELITHTDTDNEYSIGIPASWRQTLIHHDGNDMYVHAESATSVEITKGSYDPTLLQMTHDVKMSELVAAGCELIDFQWEASNVFHTVYKVVNGEQTTVYLEKVLFNRKSAIKITFTVNADFYDRVITDISAIELSLQWNEKADEKIPDGTYLVSADALRCDFVFPNDWQAGVSDNIYRAQDQSGASITIVATKSTATYEGTKLLNYSSYARYFLYAEGRVNFTVQKYNATANIIEAYNTYSQNGQTWVLVQYLIATGQYEYVLSFDCAEAQYKTLEPLFNNVRNTFRYY